MLLRLAKRFRNEFFPKLDAFDVARGTETSGKVTLLRLRVLGERSKSKQYHGIDPELFARAAAHVPHDLPFVDIGCGKGRALILAHEAGFSDVSGIEFAPSLARTALRNLARLNITARIHESDASTFPFPQTAGVYFLFNPFGPETMRTVVSKLYGYVIYANPKFPEAFHDFTRVHESPGILICARLLGGWYSESFSSQAS